MSILIVWLSAALRLRLFFKSSMMSKKIVKSAIVKSLRMKSLKNKKNQL